MMRRTLRFAGGAAVIGTIAAAAATAQTTTTTATQARPATAPAGVVCATPPAYGPGGGMGPQYGFNGGENAKKGNAAKVALTRNQLLINQRISQAAIRRVNAVQQWLDAGVVGTDICGGALAAEDLGGMTLSTEPAGPLPKPPTPRALDVKGVGGGNPGKVKLSRDQLLINQRISQEAVRRSNALRKRLETGLTGGDVKDGTIVANNLRQGLRIMKAPAVTPAAASTTVLAPKAAGNPAGIRLSAGQLLINQRISQAAVRRSNGLMAHLRTGLNGSDFRVNTITGVDLAPGVVRP